VDAVFPDALADTDRPVARVLEFFAKRRVMTRHPVISRQNATGYSGTGVVVGVAVAV